MGDFYILDANKNAIPASCEEWGNMFKSDRTVAKDEQGDIFVSTVFMGLDHQLGDGPPLLFETMIFGGEHDGEQWRCSTWTEAEDGHRKACVLAGITEPAP